MHEVTHWKHKHDFRSPGQTSAERRTLWVIALSAVTMLAEIIAGTLTGSMALLADGWHMATHVGALSITAITYAVARRYSDHPRFTFGTGKVANLGGYTSAVILAVVALIMAGESVSRLMNPETVHFREAMLVAWIGLAVNLISAWLLGHHHHDHSHAHSHDHANDAQHTENHDHAAGETHGQDHNLRAAYLHVIADALTSVLAIVALWSGQHLNWYWLDPMVGIVGAIVISRWAYGLLLDTGSVLLDAENHSSTETLIEERIHREDSARISDLHIWRVGSNSTACIVSLVTHSDNTVDYYKSLLEGIPGLKHITVEVNICNAEACSPL